MDLETLASLQQIRVCVSPCRRETIRVQVTPGQQRQPADGSGRRDRQESLRRRSVRSHPRLSGADARERRVASVTLRNRRLCLPLARRSRRGVVNRTESIRQLRQPASEPLSAALFVCRRAQTQDLSIGVDDVTILGER